MTVTKLEKLAKGATPGVWLWRKVGGDFHLMNEDHKVVLCVDGAGNLLTRDHSTNILSPFSPEHPDAEFIEAANPKTILYLIESWRKLKEELVVVKEQCEDAYDRGFLEGSRVGDATANAFKKERDDDMSRLHDERVRFVKERDQLLAELATKNKELEILEPLIEAAYRVSHANYPGNYHPDFAPDFEDATHKLTEAAVYYVEACYLKEKVVGDET